MSWLYLSKPCAFFRYFSTRRCGCIQRPAFPAPSVRERDNEMSNLGRNRVARLRTCVYPPSLRANGPRECAPDDRLREAIQLCRNKKAGLLPPSRRGASADCQPGVAGEASVDGSSLSLLAMTA